MIVAVLKTTVLTNWWTLISFSWRSSKLFRVFWWIVPSAPKISGTISILVFHNFCSSIARSKHLSHFSLYLSTTCLSMTQATSKSFVQPELLSMQTYQVFWLKFFYQWKYWSHTTVWSYHCPKLPGAHVATSVCNEKTQRHQWIADVTALWRFKGRLQWRNQL